MPPAWAFFPSHMLTASRLRFKRLSQALAQSVSSMPKAGHQRQVRSVRGPGGSPTAADLCVFAHRASWFRLLPMRAIWRVRSRSMALAGAVHVPVCAIARRNNSDGDTPAAAAFSRQAARSAGVTRAASVTVRRTVTC